MIRPMLLGLGLAAAPVAAYAEPIGRWFSGFGQGTVEYGIRNDSAGSDYLYIACAPDRTYISLTVGGAQPRSGDRITITIDADEFEIMAGEHGYFQTGSHVESDTFRAVWESMRAGSNMRVRLSTGQSTNFTLSGSARTLGPQPCETDFER